MTLNRFIPAQVTCLPLQQKKDYDRLSELWQLWCTQPKKEKISPEMSRHQVKSPEKDDPNVVTVRRGVWAAAGCNALKLSTNLNRHQTTQYTSSPLQLAPAQLSCPILAPAVTGLLTWRLVHFQIKYQLCGVGHHHVPPVSFLAGFFCCPNCVIHCFRVA